MISRVVLSALVALCLANSALGQGWQCGCTKGSGCAADYDLSPLMKTSGEYAVTDSGKFAFVYDFNICNIIPTSIAPTTCATNKGMICQSFGGNYVGTIAAWNAGAAPLWSSIDANNPNKGVQAQFANGDGCNGSPRTSLLTFNCDPSADVLQSNISTTGSGCAYNFAFTTKYACVGGAGGSSKKSSGLSGGWVFIIILLVCSFVYVVAGCAFNHYKANKEGAVLSLREKCPNNGFWCALPGLTKDGCIFSYRGIRSCFARCTGGNSGYASQA